jgi:hypothetical protein
MHESRLEARHFTRDKKQSLRVVLNTPIRHRFSTLSQSLAPCRIPGKICRSSFLAASEWYFVAANCESGLETVVVFPFALEAAPPSQPSHPGFWQQQSRGFLLLAQTKLARREQRRDF